MYMAKSIPISVTVDQELLAQIDADVARTRLSRSAWLALAAEGLLSGNAQRPYTRQNPEDDKSATRLPVRSFDPDEVTDV